VRIPDSITLVGEGRLEAPDVLPLEDIYLMLIVKRLVPRVKQVQSVGQGCHLFSLAGILRMYFVGHGSIMCAQSTSEPVWTRPASAMVLMRFAILGWILGMWSWHKTALAWSLIRSSFAKR
jgi:hypothetical protein